MLSSTLYTIIFRDHINYDRNYNWLINVKHIFDTCCLSYIWMNHNVNCSRNILLNTLAVNLQNQFRQRWKSDIEESSTCLNYKIFKREHCFENYLVTLSASCLQTCINFKTSNNDLPIETGSWLRIQRNERKCSKCDLNEIGDRFHYIYRCNLFNDDIRIHVPMANVRYPNTMLFKAIMCELNRKKLVNLSKFIKIV